ncbi:MAG: zinc-binding alcohol dehydrogenase family protein [Propionibacteriaceae bacterium]|nr:zinc-binding alcohol dehydrogenase family protein [Propionibacteriaceae bacterium]
MRAIGYTEAGPASVLADIELPEPVAVGRDLLVGVHAVSVNPVDTKVRVRGGAAPGEQYKVLGWDVAGTVLAVGADVTRFAPDDEVFYAGTLNRPGGNSELHLVDERIVAHKPASLDFAGAAALPLTSITAWELLFDRLGVPRDGGQGRTLLVVGAAGGVGSILVQLAARLTGLRVVGTASRPQTAEWVRALGADAVVDHGRPLAAQLADLGIDAVEYIASLTHTDDHFPDLVKVLAPQGRIGLIDDPAELDARLLKQKAASLHWEYMFARPMFDTPDVAEQGRILAEVARLADAGVLRTTMDAVHGEICAANLRRAHEFIESGRARGKVVLAGWPN